ncbi:hypothetical protein LTR53_010838 [Teratosphaeriaceae sp. CCFEE 6253]|nr:hypothetical protein LTR53_010838 [Teratosphaeriaceae sp. CCFEE 6253]
MAQQHSRHRCAGIALFRALLSQCAALPHLESHQRNELQNIARNRFKQARHEQSARRLRLLFEAGYEAIDHLDAAVAGDEKSQNYVAELLRKAPARVKQAPSIIFDDDVMHELKRRVHERPEAHKKPSDALFARPLLLSQLSGKRHVPVLYNAQGIPVLRLSKPQPESLSGYINHRVQRKQKRHDTRQRLDVEGDLAWREDEWDGILAEQTGVVDGSGEKARERGWGHEIGAAKREVFKKLEEDSERNRVMAEKMQAVVDREEEQARVEREQRQSSAAGG